MKYPQEFLWFTGLLLILLVQLAYSKQTKKDNVNKLKNAKMTRANKDRGKCEIEIVTKGKCMVNDNLVKPRIVLHLKTKPRLKSPAERIKDSDLNSVDTDNPVQQKQDRFDYSNSKDLEYKKKVIFEFVSQIVQLMKMEYGPQLKPLNIDTIQSVQLNNYGVADVYQMKIYGMDSLETVDGSVEMEDSLESTVWAFNVTFFVANITADFLADVNINEKIFVKNWNLAIMIENCSFKSSFVLNFEDKTLFIQSLHMKSFGDFKLISEHLTWPFNEIVSNIVSQEKYFIRNIIENYSQRYINMTLSNYFDLNAILPRIFQ